MTKTALCWNRALLDHDDQNRALLDQPRFVGPSLDHRLLDHRWTNRALLDHDERFVGLNAWKRLETLGNAWNAWKRLETLWNERFGMNALLDHDDPKGVRNKEELLQEEVWD